LSADSITPSGDTFYSAFYLKTQPEDPHPHACVAPKRKKTPVCSRRRRRCHTNARKFLAMQADYRAGRLTHEGEERFEAVCNQLHRLY
jgi:hypothetical protein